MVYVDVLLVVNFFMTLLLLLLTAALTKQPRRTGRLCIAAMLGAAYSLILLVPKLPTWVVMLSKIAVALVLVLAAFGFGSVKKYLRCLLCFLAANFVLLGFIVGVWLLFRPRRIVVKNSAVYFDLPARTLLLLALAAYVLALLILRLYEKHAGRRALLELTVDTGARQVRCFALADSGNRAARAILRRTGDRGSSQFVSGYGNASGDPVPNGGWRGYAHCFSSPSGNGT